MECFVNGYGEIVKFPPQRDFMPSISDEDKIEIVTIKNKVMSKDKFVEIQIPEGHEIDKDNSTFEKIVFKKIESKYPLSVKEIDDRDFYVGSSGDVWWNDDSNNINQVSSRERAEALLALIQLVELRDACNDIDGSKDWDYDNDNHVIRIRNNRIGRSRWSRMYNTLHFRKESTRDWFLETHYKLIETAKEFI